MKKDLSICQTCREVEVYVVMAIREGCCIGRTEQLCTGARRWGGYLHRRWLCFFSLQQMVLHNVWRVILLSCGWLVFILNFIWTIQLQIQTHRCMKTQVHGKGVYYLKDVLICWKNSAKYKTVSMFCSSNRFPALWDSLLILSLGAEHVCNLSSPAITGESEAIRVLFVSVC